MKIHPSSSEPVFLLAVKRINKLLKEIEAAGTAADELVHDLRVCTKSLRALLRLYRPYCAKDCMKSVDIPIKKLADSYADQRDAHVQYELLLDVVNEPGLEGEIDTQALLRCYTNSRKPVIKQQVTMAVREDFLQILESWQENLASVAVTDIVPGVDLSYQKARDHAQAAVLSDKDETYHACRRWVKYYYYQLRLLLPKSRRKQNEFIKEIAVLGDVLGKLHDRGVLQRNLSALLPDVKQDVSGDTNMAEIILGVLTRLEEQKRQDKIQCHQIFESLFAFDKNPVSGLSIKGI